MQTYGRIKFVCGMSVGFIAGAFIVVRAAFKNDIIREAVVKVTSDKIGEFFYGSDDKKG